MQADIAIGGVVGVERKRTHDLKGVRSATVFGQSMHLLVDEIVRRAEIDEKLHRVGISHAEIHEIGPSLEDVFVTLSAKYAGEQQKAA